jgi:hypothetical protein
MKTAAAFALFLPLALAAAMPASAKLNPMHQLPFDQPDVHALHTGPAAAMLERNYFQAPQKPVATSARPVAPCTVQTVVFDKARLAQACY